MLHHHWATATLPPIFLNEDWRLWSCLVAMAASAFTFSPHSVECACCSLQTSVPQQTQVCSQTGPSQGYLPPALITDSLLIPPPTLHFPFLLLLMQYVFHWVPSDDELCSFTFLYFFKLCWINCGSGGWLVRPWKCPWSLVHLAPVHTGV